ncbi:MAG: hypothetical protein ACK52A_13120, partial [Planctomycetota bacterium]
MTHIKLVTKIPLVRPLDVTNPSNRPFQTFFSMPAFYRPKFGRLPEAPRGLLRSRLLACTLGVFLALGPAWMHWLASFTGHH